MIFQVIDNYETRWFSDFWCPCFDMFAQLLFTDFELKGLYRRRYKRHEKQSHFENTALQNISEHKLYEILTY